MKRRNVLAGLAATLTAGCSKIGDSQAFANLVDGAEKLHKGAHRLLGGGVAMALADRDAPDVLVTIGTFTRLRDMVSGLARAMAPDAYRNLDRAKTITAPWFLVHGFADDVVPAAHGQALHAIAGEAGRSGASFAIVGGGHRPNGATLLRILEAIRTREPGGAPSTGAVPDSVKVIPFGQTTPLPAG